MPLPLLAPYRRMAQVCLFTFAEMSSAGGSLKILRRKRSLCLIFLCLFFTPLPGPSWKWEACLAAVVRGSRPWGSWGTGGISRTTMRHISPGSLPLSFLVYERRRVVSQASLNSKMLTLPLYALIAVYWGQLAIVVEGDMSPQNMALWHKNCFELKAFEFLKFLSA